MKKLYLYGLRDYLSRTRRGSYNDLILYCMTCSTRFNVGPGTRAYFNLLISDKLPMRCLSVSLIIVNRSFRAERLLGPDGTRLE